MLHQRTLSTCLSCLYSASHPSSPLLHTQPVIHHRYKAMSVHLSVHTQPVIHHRYTHLLTHLPVDSPIHLPTHPLI